MRRLGTTNFGIVMMLLVVMLIASFGKSSAVCSQSAEIEIKAIIPPIIIIDQPKNGITWELNPASSGKFFYEVTLNVKSNVPWQFIATDYNQVNPGYMSEWTGMHYTTHHLKNPIEIMLSSDMEFVESRFAKEDMLKYGRNVSVILTQIVVNEDLPLKGNCVYRIVLGFEGVPVK